MRKTKHESRLFTALKKGCTFLTASTTMFTLALPTLTAQASPMNHDEQQSTTAEPMNFGDSDQFKVLWQPFTATYEIRSSKVPFTGKVERSLNQSPEGHWVANSNAKAFASKVHETSHFMLTSDCKVKSTAFSYKRKVFGKTKAWSITTDWATQQIHYQAKKQDQKLDFTSETLADRLSEQFSVRCFVGMGVEHFTIDAVRRDQLKTQKYKRIGSENLDTAIGTIEAVKVEKQHESDKRKTSLWFSPQHNYRLVKLIQTDEGETLTIDIKKLP